MVLPEPLHDAPHGEPPCTSAGMIARVRGRSSALGEHGEGAGESRLRLDLVAAQAIA